MSLPDLVTKLRYLYHLEMIDINNVLYQLHIRNDDRAEEKGAEHTMVIFNDILPRLYGKEAVDNLIKKGKER